MSILILMIPMALLFVAGFVYAFFWATGSGQFDDTTTPAMRMLSNDELDNSKKLKNIKPFKGGLGEQNPNSIR